MNTFNLPPGCSQRDIDGAQPERETPHDPREDREPWEIQQAFIDATMSHFNLPSSPRFPVTPPHINAAPTVHGASAIVASVPGSRDDL